MLPLAVQGRMCSLPLSASGVYQYCLVCGFIILISASVVTLPSFLLSVSNLLLSSYKVHVVAFRAHLDNPVDNVSISKSLIITWVSFLPYDNIQRFQGLGCGCLFGEPLFMQPTTIPVASFSSFFLSSFFFSLIFYSFSSFRSTKWQKDWLNMI